MITLLVSTLFVFGVSLLLGLIFSDYNELGIIFSDIEYLFAYFIKLIGFFSFCLFLGILVKRSAFALGFLLIWSIVEGIVYGFLKWEIFRNSDLADNIMELFPLASMSNLIKEPFSRLGAVQSAASQLGEAFDKDYSVQFLTVLIVLIWTCLFVYGSYAILKKRDL